MSKYTFPKMGRVYEIKRQVGTRWVLQHFLETEDGEVALLSEVNERSHGIWLTPHQYSDLSEVESHETRRAGDGG